MDGLCLRCIMLQVAIGFVGGIYTSPEMFGLKTTNQSTWAEVEPPAMDISSPGIRDESPEKGTGKKKWFCPVVLDVEGVSCLCDHPHTVRCRGKTSASDSVLQVSREIARAAAAGGSVSLIDLDIHNLKYIPSSAFEGLQPLGLVLSSAGIKNISAKAFSGLENSLIALGLPGNELTEIPADAIRYLKKLQRLDLSYNKIEDLPSEVFPLLPSLQNVNLAGNNLRFIKPKAFIFLPQLRTLNLARNQLDVSQLIELCWLHFLVDLSIQANLLKGALSPSFLGPAHMLNSLDVSHNALTKVLFDALQNSRNLRILDLSHNQIDVIEDHAFRRLSNLQTLDLSHNRVVALSGWSMAHLKNLNHLNLADNALRALTADLLHELSSLRSLDLTANDISLIQPEIFNYTQNLVDFKLADNPLHCDCSLVWLWHWLHEHNLTDPHDKEEVICATPLSLENAPLIELNVAKLTCSEETSGTDYYHDYYHDSSDEEPLELKRSSAKIYLEAASWEAGDIKLIWKVDEEAVNYTCEGIHIYEEKMYMGIPHEVLTEKINLNCTSENQTNPYRVETNIPLSLLTPGSTYTYCLSLLVHSTGDVISFLPGCSEKLRLSVPSSRDVQEQHEVQITGLTAGVMGTNLVVKTRFKNEGDGCIYRIYVFRNNVVAAIKELNCTEVRHTFSDLSPGYYYEVCVTTGLKSLQTDLESMKPTHNATASLYSIFPECTSIHFLDKSSGKWLTNSVLVLAFTVPGLALLLTLYVLGRRVWKGGGVPWKWDPRGSKNAKYFLYTGENINPSCSFEPLPISNSETTTRV